MVCDLANCGPHTSVKCKTYAGKIFTIESRSVDKQVELQEDGQQKHKQRQELQAEAHPPEPKQPKVTPFKDTHQSITQNHIGRIGVGPTQIYDYEVKVLVVVVGYEMKSHHRNHT